MARRILLSGNQLCLLVMDGEEYDQAVSQGLDLRSLARNHRGEDCQQPRMCHITRDTATGLGINFVPVEGETVDIVRTMYVRSDSNSLRRLCGIVLLC